MEEELYKLNWWLDYYHEYEIPRIEQEMKTFIAIQKRSAIGDENIVKSFCSKSKNRTLDDLKTYIYNDDVLRDAFVDKNGNWSKLDEFYFEQLLDKYKNSSI